MSDLLTSRLLDPSYSPSTTTLPTFLTPSKKECPVRFTTDIVEFCEHEEFLGTKLRPLQKNFLVDLYSLDDSGYPKYDTGVFIAGMRGGKSALAAFIAAFQVHRLLSMKEPALELHQIKGQRLTIQFIANSEAQAKETAYATFETLITDSFWYQKYIGWLKEREREEHLPVNSLFEHKAQSIEFYEKNVAILSLNSNSATAVGKTSACCIFDELSRFDVAENDIQAKSQKRVAQAIYDGVAKAATSLMPFSKVVTITSPMYEDDYGMRLLYQSGTFKGGEQSGIIHTLRRQYPDKAERMLGYHYTTFEMNPLKDANGNIIPGGFSPEQSFFKSKRNESPEGFRRDFLAIPPSAVSPFFEYPERIESCIVKNSQAVIFFDREFQESVDRDGLPLSVRHYIGKSLEIVKPNKMKDYYISCDQGEKKDAFVVAMAHGETIAYRTVNTEGKEIEYTRYKVIIDFIECWVPDREKRVTVYFPNVEEIIFKLHQNFNIKKVVFDQWNSTESIQRLFSKGIMTEKTNPSENLKKYEILKTLFYNGLIEMPQNDRLLKELRQLNLIRGQKVDHSSSGSSDASDALARVVFEVYINVLQQAVQGNVITNPMQVGLPTLRGIAGMQEYMKSPMIAPTAGLPINRTPGSIGVSSVFSKGTKAPEQNVFPNFLLK